MTLPNGQPLRFDMPGARWDGTVEELNLSNPNTPMQQDEIDITITTAAEADVIAKAADLRAAILQWAVVLTQDQRDALFKLGDARMAFHEKSNDYFHQHAELVSPTVNMTKYDRDQAALDAVGRIQAAVKGATDPLDDTEMLLGSDLLSADVAQYKYLPLLIRAKTAGAEAVHADLKASWPGRGPSPRPPTPPTP
jgi:hypothetical protein